MCEDARLPDLSCTRDEYNRELPGKLPYDRLSFSWYPHADIMQLDCKFVKHKSLNLEAPKGVVIGAQNFKIRHYLRSPVRTLCILTMPK